MNMLIVDLDDKTVLPANVIPMYVDSNFSKPNNDHDMLEKLRKSQDLEDKVLLFACESSDQAKCGDNYDGDPKKKDADPEDSLVVFSLQRASTLPLPSHPIEVMFGNLLPTQML